MKLKNLIICPKCQSIHKKLPLKKGEVARCTNCREILYKDGRDILKFYLSFSFTALVFLSISMFFPIVNIDLAGFDSSLNILQAVISLFDSGYNLVALFSGFVLVIFPFCVIVFLFFAALFMQLKIFKNIVRWLLIIVSFLDLWSMLDIFFISILVATVKIFDYATISVGISFYSMVVFILLEIYLTKHMRIEELWDEWEEIWGK